MSDRRGGTLALAWAWLLAAAAAATPAAYGGTFGSVSAPASGKPTLGGLMLRVDVNWVQGPGYLPVRVTITDTTPVPGDRTFTMELTGQAYGAGEVKVSARQEIELPGGASSATAMISLPTAGMWPSIGCKVWEDGNRIDDLAITLPPNNGIQWGSPTRETNVLFVTAGGASKDLLPLVEAMGQRGYWTPNSSPSGGTTFPAHGATGIELVDQADLSRRWIDYVGIDVVCLGLAELAEMQARHDAALDAIRHWIWAGGNLWVYGISDDQQLAQLESLVLPSREETAEDAAPRWRTLTPAHCQVVAAAAKSAMQAERVFTGGNVAPVELDDDGNPVAPDPAQEGPRIEVPFRWRSVQLGQVVAIAAADPIQQFTALEWRFIRLAGGLHRNDWAARHGMSLIQANPDFWSFLIAGVGLPPVTAFRVLITVFTILIGPVNYWWLRKSRRLHLLLFVVPLSAAAVTLVLGVYALVSDGFSTQLRSRSYTLLDQASGESQSWTRLSYYAGLAPTQGLRFSRETAVLPIQYAAGGKTFDNSRSVNWGDDQQLENGWLNARTPTQYLAIRAARSQRSLQIASTPAGPQVTNRLGVPIRRLLLCDTEGQPYYGGTLATDASATLAAAASRTSELRAALSELRGSVPTAPPAMQQIPNPTWRRRRSYYMYGYMVQAVAAPPTSSRLEQSFAAASAAFAQAGGEDSGEARSLSIQASGSEVDVREAVLALAPRRYWAIVERPPDAELGVSSVVADQGGSFHVVEGAW